MIHTYAIYLNIGRVIIGKGRSIDFTHPSKPQLLNYTTTVGKLLSMVETLQKHSPQLYMGSVSQIRTTSETREPSHTLSATWAHILLRKGLIIN